METLGNLGERGKEAVPALIDCLEDSSSDVRSSAAQALGNLGEHAKDAVPALIETLRDSDSIVRDTATEALGNLSENEGRARKFAKLN